MALDSTVSTGQVLNISNAPVSMSPCVCDYLWYIHALILVL